MTVPPPGQPTGSDPNAAAPAGLAPATLAVVAGRPAAVPGAALNPPLVAASTFRADGVLGYAREGNPTWEALEEAVGALDGGSAVAFGSGLAAANAVLDTVAAGGIVVAPTHAYAGVQRRLDELAATGRIAVRRVPVADAAAVAAALPAAALLWLETPTNPVLEVADLAAAVADARRAGVRVLCDSTFATPLLQRPLALGVDLVLHSATKLLSGHSDALLGLVVARDPADAAVLRERRELLGATPGVLEAYLVLRGVRTLPVRLARAQETAGVLARRLCEHPAVARVRYPGLPTDPGHVVAARQMAGPGTIVSVDVAGDAAAAERVCTGVRLWVHATSLGGVESSLERRRRWPAERPDVPDSLLRLSVGCEDVADLWADLDQALRAAVTAT